jgi:concentrative nucleoside transporter, CNT family
MIPTGCFGVVAILLLAYSLSGNKALINWRLVVSGLSLQVLLAIFCLKVPLGQQLFHQLGQAISQLLDFSTEGASFVFGFLVSKPNQLNELFGAGSSFVFAFKLVPTIIFVSVLVNGLYHLGVMQWIVRWVAWVVYKLMGASGSEALSNTASIFVGQIEAQLLIRPYLSTMTQSELLASMSGGMACIAGSVMAVYIQMGIPAEFLLTASLMAVPGALVISKLVCPESEHSVTRGTISLEVRKESVNLIDALSRGATEGLKIGLNVCAMLIGFISLIALFNFLLQAFGRTLFSWGVNTGFLGLDIQHLSLNTILGQLFYWVAILVGVPQPDAQTVGSLMGTKLVLNEFVAYADLAPMIGNGQLSPKALAIASVALCGFANLSSVAMQVGGIGAMVPERKNDLARLGMKALLCGTLASYLSSALVGILTDLSQGAASPLITQSRPATLATTLWGADILTSIALVALVCLVMSCLFPKKKDKQAL